MKKNAFTLIELLVVIAIIALLLSIIMPSLSLVKQKAASIVCLTNAKNLSLGWFSYTEDNNGHIMSSMMGGIPSSGGFGLNGPIPGWINTPYDESETPLSCVSRNVVTDEDELRGVMDGALWPYLESPDVYNCPADKVKALPQYDTVDPEKFVTFALPRCLAANNRIGGTVYTITKLSEISTPSMRYNFIETAEERNYNMNGHFSFGSKERMKGPSVWWNPMAVNHGDSSVLGFCDGHAELHKWQDSWTKERVEKLSQLGVTSYSLDTDSGFTSENSVDLAYMESGWAYSWRGN